MSMICVDPGGLGTRELTQPLISFSRRAVPYPGELSPVAWAWKRRLRENYHSGHHNERAGLHMGELTLTWES